MMVINEKQKNTVHYFLVTIWIAVMFATKAAFSNSWFWIMLAILMTVSLFANVAYYRGLPTETAKKSYITDKLIIVGVIVLGSIVYFLVR